MIRYDHRDTGRSVTYPPDNPAYTLDDMVADAIGVLDAYGIARAHIAGMSLGGMIAQLAALDYPDRVLTITLIASSPHGPEDADLPPMDEKFLAFYQTVPPPDWTDEAAAVDYMVAGRRILNGSAHPFDEQRTRELATQEMQRARNIAVTANHALIDSTRWRERLGAITIPALVIHGSEDPVLPYGHGLALAREIPGAILLTLEGTGHEVHRDDWETIIKAMLRHTGGC